MLVMREGFLERRKSATAFGRQLGRDLSRLGFDDGKRREAPATEILVELDPDECRKVAGEGAFSFVRRLAVVVGGGHGGILPAGQGAEFSNPHVDDVVDVLQRAGEFDQRRFV